MAQKLQVKTGLIERNRVSPRKRKTILDQNVSQQNSYIFNLHG
jgi:hypothetical protein